MSVVLGAGLLLPVPGPAQGLPGEAWGGAVLGALIGGLVGADRCQAFSGNGAAIGAGIGLAAGALIGLSRSSGPESEGMVAAAPVISEVHGGVGHGWGRGHCSGGWVGYSATVVPTATVGAAPAPVRPGSYVLPATVAGAASGALIGAGTRSVGTGLAVGTAAGLLVGTVAEHQARARAGVRMTDGTAVCAAAAAPAAPVQPPSLPSPHAQITSRPCANSTYYWTAPPTVPEAPRVPDAPRF